MREEGRREGKGDGSREGVMSEGGEKEKTTETRLKRQCQTCSTVLCGRGGGERPEGNKFVVL